jgi:hypothetical protein
MVTSISTIHTNPSNKTSLLLSSLQYLWPNVAFATCSQMIPWSFVRLSLATYATYVFFYYASKLSLA